MEKIKITMLFPIASDGVSTGIPSDIILGLRNPNCIGLIAWLSFLATREDPLIITIKSISNHFNISSRKVIDGLNFLEYCDLIKTEKI